jgi:hypothetical protein
MAGKFSDQVSRRYIDEEGKFIATASGELGIVIGNRDIENLVIVDS